MRNRIIGGLGILLGGFAIFGGLMKMLAPAPPGGSAYGAGGAQAIFFGLVLIGVGIRYVIKGDVPPPKKKKKKKKKPVLEE